jgi:hypothetical protein
MIRPDPAPERIDSQPIVVMTRGASGWWPSFSRLLRIAQTLPSLLRSIQLRFRLISQLQKSFFLSWGSQLATRHTGMRAHTDAWLANSREEWRGRDSGSPLSRHKEMFASQRIVLRPLAVADKARVRSQGSPQVVDKVGTGTGFFPGPSVNMIPHSTWAVDPEQVHRHSPPHKPEQKISRLGGVVVSVLATGPKGCGFEPGQDDGFLRAIKIRSTPSSRMGSKAGRSHVVNFYGM